MPRTDITITQLDRSGITQPAQQNGDAANGMQLPWNDGKIILELSSSSGTTIFTFVLVPTVDAQVPAFRTVSCGAAVVKLAGPFPESLYNQPGGGQVFINMDNTTLGRIRAYHL